MTNPHGRTIGESTYYEMYLRRPDVGRFLTRDKKLPTSGHGLSEGEIKELEKKCDSTYYDVYLRRPDIGRFLTWEKKLPTSGRGRWEWEKKRWVHLQWRVPRTVRRQPIFDPRQNTFKLGRLAIARIKNQYQCGINTKRKIMRCLGECSFWEKWHDELTGVMK